MRSPGHDAEQIGDDSGRYRGGTLLARLPGIKPGPEELGQDQQP
jgi:hypothetical protein